MAEKTWMNLQPEQSTTRPSIAESSKWVLTGTLLSKPILLVTNVLLARLLGPANFGVLGLATSMAVTLSLIASIGLGDASYKYVAEYYRSDKARGARMAAVIVWSTTTFSAIVFLTLWLLRTVWVHKVFPSSVSSLVIALCLCLAWMNLLFAVLSGIFAGLQNFRDFTILSLLQAIALAALASTLGFGGTVGALLAYVIGSALCIAWGLARLFRTDRALIGWPGLNSFRELKQMLNFSTPIWIGSFALSPVVTFTFILLARQPGGDSQLGIFNTANGLRMMIVILPSVIATVITPALIQEGGLSGDRDAFRSLLDKSFSAMALATIPLLIFCLFFSDLLLSIYGKAYAGSFRLFMPLVAAAAVGAVGAPLITVMMAKNKTWWSLFFGFLKSLLLIVLCFWWVPTHLATGLAWAFFFSEVSFYLIAFEFCIQGNTLSAELRSTFYSSTLAIGLLLMMALWLPSRLRWFSAIPLTILAGVYILRSQEDLAKWLPNIVPRALQPRAQKLLALIAS